MGKFLDEYEYLIHLVRCAIHDLQPRELPDGLSFERVYEWGVNHHIANIAFYSVEKLASKPEVQLYSEWQRCCDQAVVREINQSHAAQELREALQEGGVRWVEVQGTKLKPLYPQPDFRTMSDLDFIIDPENVPKIKDILEALGYEWEDVYDAEVNAHRYPNINVEMHTEYFLEDCEYRQVMHSPFASVDEKGQCELDVFYLYNILHIAKHYFTGGCGIRRVLDVYYLDEACGHLLHGDYIQEVLERARAAEFAAELRSLANAWFGKEEQELPRSKMATYIMDSGLHGSCVHAQKNQLNKVIDMTERFAKLKYLLGRFLGNSEDLRTRYPVLERHKILYPFCWLRRIFCALKPGRFRCIKREVKVVKSLEEAPHKEHNMPS